MASAMDKFSVKEGSIVDGIGGILYDASELEGLSLKAKRRLAKLHTIHSGIDWEHAEEILKKEGLLAGDVKAGGARE